MANKLQNIIGSGIPAAPATFISGTGGDLLTATGSTQATALLLPNDNNGFGTVASGTGAILQDGSPGDECFVANFGANALLVYPPIGQSINALSANAGFSIAAAGKACFIKLSATRWATNLSA